MLQFGLIRRGHDNDARQTAEIVKVEAARVGRAVSAHKPRAIDGKADRKALQDDVVNDLVIGALEETGIDRSDGF